MCSILRSPLALPFTDLIPNNDSRAWIEIKNEGKSNRRSIGRLVLRGSRAEKNGKSLEATTRGPPRHHRNVSVMEVGEEAGSRLRCERGYGFILDNVKCSKLSEGSHETPATATLWDK